MLSLEFDALSKSILLSTTTLAKDVYIYIEDYDLKLSDNYFDLIPSITKKV